MPASSLDQLVALCKRRGFIFPASQLYGGLQGFYDYGPMGVELKNNLKAAWWKHMVYLRDDVEGLDSSIIMHRRVLQHSGHEQTFTDPMVDCRQCKGRFRADFIVNGQCLACGSTDLTPPRPFNLMFKTQVGPIVDEESADAVAYLRPETAQGIFTNFKNVWDSLSPKLPFGIAQIGKAFRNEITPRNFIFRVREFEQMELEFFVKPGEDDAWHTYWVDARKQWWIEQGLPAEHLILKEQAPDELAHYSKATVDICYRFPHGDEELEGIANRTDYDLGSHTKSQETLGIQAQVLPNSDSLHKMAVQDLETKRWEVPYIIEPSAGVDRGVLAVLCEAYDEETLADGSIRTVLRLKPHLAPIKVAVIPLAKNKPEMVAYAQSIVTQLRKWIPGRVVLENSGNIGKSYRRHDEIGTPFCITVDFETLGLSEDALDVKDTVTVRDRDTLAQQRISVSMLDNLLREFF